MTLLVVVPSLLAAASIVALAFALRGRRVDDHPVCRKCGFDLFGKPDSSSVCSECGADLGRRQAVRVGRRERRGKLAAVAAPPLVVCLTWLSLLGWGTARGLDWNQRKPVWWLIREARGANVATRDAAFVELTSRFKAGRLDPLDVGVITDAALDVQGNPDRIWTVAASDVIDAVRDAKQMPPARWQRYVRQAAPPQLKVRPNLCRGDPLVLAVYLPPPRVSRGHPLDVELDWMRLRVGGVNVVQYGNRVGRQIRSGQGGGEVASVLPVDAAVARLPDGPQVVSATVHWTVSEPKASGAALVDEEVELSAPLTILPPAAPRAVKLNTDPALRERVEKSLTVSRLGVGPGPARASSRGEGSQLFLHVRAANPPVGMSFRAILRSGHREWEIGLLRFPPGDTTGRVTAADFTLLEDFDAARVDLVLKPSAEAATETAGLMEIWGGEVVIKNVAVDPPPPRGVPGE
jgi:hypothetical protein